MSIKQKLDYCIKLLDPKAKITASATLLSQVDMLVQLIEAKCTDRQCDYSDPKLTDDCTFTSFPNTIGFRK